MSEGSQYWDLFELRIEETIAALKAGTLPPLRRLSLHITNRCNLKCSYCNETHTPKSLDRGLFEKLVLDYEAMGGGVLHITGGEPSCIPWLFEEIARLGEAARKVDFHLNTNLIADVPIEALRHIKRLKVSLDTYRPDYFDSLVGISGAFEKVMFNLKAVNELPEDLRPTTSITYTMTHENFRDMPGFLKLYYRELPNMYAAFFSAYKGTNPRFAFTEQDIDSIFSEVKPELDALFEKFGDGESKFLFNASHDRQTFVEGVRFDENRSIPCFLQLSELVVNEDGEVANCSHLYRDGTSHTGDSLADWSLADIFERAKKDTAYKVMSDKCLYGCNKKLVTFNKAVQGGL